MSNVTALPVATATGNPLDALDNPAQFEHMQRVAKAFCASALIPAHMRGNNGADALLALAIAKRMGEDPVMVMQNIYVVHGRAGWSAQYMIARANRSGVFKGPISWREESKPDKPDYAVTAHAKVAETGEEVAFTVSMATAKAEGWSANKKYQTLGPLMLRYRSATLLIRLYCPEVMMGFQTADELEDMAAAATPGPRDITPAAEAIAQIPTGTDGGTILDAHDDADAGWPLYDALGETVGEYGVTEWLDAFDNLMAGLPPKARAQMLENNRPSADAIMGDADVPEQLMSQISDRFQAAGK